MAKYKSKCTANFIRVLEPCIILSIMTTIHVYLPRYMGCTPVDCVYVNKQNATPGRTEIRENSIQGEGAILPVQLSINFKLS